MNLEEFLKLIQPDLTVIAALFTFSILFLQLFWKFLGYEGKLREENLSKIKALILDFRSKKIETKLKEWFKGNKFEGFKMAIETLFNAIYSKEFDATEGKTIHKIKNQDEIIKIFGQTEKSNTLDDGKQRIEDETSVYVDSPEGQDFFNNLDKLYEEKQSITKIYYIMKIFCRGIWWSSLILAVLSILGIVIKLGKSPVIIANLWVFASILMFIIGLACFVLLFYNRSKLNKNWEKQQIYG